MIKYSEFKTKIKTLSFRCEEYNVETSEDITLPYCVFIPTEQNNVNADGMVLFSTLSVRLLLIDEDMVSANQYAVELILNNNDICFEKSLDFDEENRIYTFTYDFEVINDSGIVSV